jgi:3-hydroxyisobutyrate dehydrogenase-like beta-hydroxyacid dehydrogenase
MVFTMVGFPDDVREVILGADGVLAGMKTGGTLVDMTTSSPDLAQTIYGEGAARGIKTLDAPVSGGDVGAREATLAIMVGGDQPVFDAVTPLFDILGKTISLMGAAGAGQHTKMTNQILIAGTMIGVVESLLYAQRAGMDAHRVIDVIGKGRPVRGPSTPWGAELPMAISIPVFTLNTLSRIWASPWKRRGACACHCPDWPWSTSFTWRPWPWDGKTWEPRDYTGCWQP